MWHLEVQTAVENAVTVLALVVGLVAVVHCALQRSDAFPAIGTLQKPVWLAILGVATLIVLCIGVQSIGAQQDAVSFRLLFNLITLGASALYLLDVRPGIRDISDGRGPW